MIAKLISGLLILVGVIHLLALSGVLGAERLTALYGIAFQEPNLEILTRHRAVLFGLIGSFLIYAAFKPAIQPIAFIAGLLSVSSFIWLAWSIGGYNAAIRNVVIADIVALVCLLIAVGLYAVKARPS